MNDSAPRPDGVPLAVAAAVRMVREMPVPAAVLSDRGAQPIGNVAFDGLAEASAMTGAIGPALDAALGGEASVATWTRDGDHPPLDIALTPIRDDERVVGCLIVAVDSGGRAAALTAELERSRDLLQATMDSSTDMIQVFAAVRDERGRIVDFTWVLNNHTSVSRYGEVRGESLLTRNPGVVKAGIFDSFSRVTETGVPEQHVHHYVHEQFDGWFFQSVVKLGDGIATTTKDISDWKAATAEVKALQAEITATRLRETEAQLAAVFDVLPIGIGVVDTNGRTTLANAELRRFLPNTLAPSVDPARSWRWQAHDEAGQLIPPHEFPGARALRGEATMPGLEMLYVDDDGREIWTSVAATPIRDTHGAIVGQVTVVSDIDAAKRSADALRASEERLRQFGDASQDVLWIRDARSLQWTYLTPAFETIYGVSRDEALSGDNYRSWLDLIEPQDRAMAEAAMAKVRAGEQAMFEYRIRRPSDGAVRWLRDTDFPIRDADGTVTMIGGIGQDITDAKQAQTLIERSQERLSSAIGVGRVGLWDWDLRAEEVHWSDEHFRMEGYEVGEIEPSYAHWAERLHLDDREATEAALRHARDTQSEYVREFRVIHPDGTLRWLSARGRFFYDADGRPIRMIGAMVDVTARRRWEEQQKVLIAELQHRTRNLLAVVRSLADNIARTSTDVADFRARYQDRLGALARVQELLSRLSDSDRILFEDLLSGELAAMDADPAQVTLAGPKGVRLRSSTVQTLAMALHELATNAVKHGALSQRGARLAIGWRFEPAGERGQPWLHIDWRESGVAMPTASAPTGGGRGRELIEQALPYQLGAQTSYALTGDGVHCTIAVTVSASTPDHGGYG